MSVSCEPNDLMQAAKCFCYDQKQSDAVEIYLLLQISGLTLTPSELAEASACYCMPPKESEAVKAYLLCAILQALG